MHMGHEQNLYSSRHDCQAGVDITQIPSLSTMKKVLSLRWNPQDQALFLPFQMRRENILYLVFTRLPISTD